MYKRQELLLARRNAAGTQLNAYERLLAGSMGGVISVAVTYPLDLVRARITIQTASLKKLDKGKLTKPPTVFGTISHVYTHEGGFTALYKGIVPTTCLLYTSRCV